MSGRNCSTCKGSHVSRVGAVLFAAAAPIALFAAAPAHAEPVARTAPEPPYIDHTEWVHWGDLSSLRVYPTPAGRQASTDFVSADEAWSEVVAGAPDANQPGMRAQFVCHWRWAEFAQPGKVSWNLEPWRPVVDDNEMMLAGCNPGGTEEPS
jgi:hypothetical protein